MHLASFKCQLAKICIIFVQYVILQDFLPDIARLMDMHIYIFSIVKFGDALVLITSDCAGAQ